MSKPTVQEFIVAAYADCQLLTDEGDQLHRRAAVGRLLCVHVHGWDVTANGRAGGMAVTLRLYGQYTNRGVRFVGDTEAEAQEFAEDARTALTGMAPPISGKTVAMSSSTKTMLMNPRTGSVQSAQEWADEGFTPANAELIEVAKIGGDWVEVDAPRISAGRPAEMTGGKRVNVYLDADSLTRAADLGGGNVSEGIRQALRVRPDSTAARVTIYVFDNELLGDQGDNFGTALIDQHEGTEAECLAWFAGTYDINDYTSSFTAP